MQTARMTLTALPSCQTEDVLPVRESVAKSILSPVTGFLRQAGFTHSLSPARNCTFGCTYCYVPTMRIYGGLKPEDWRRWGQFTTIKSNAAALLEREARPSQVIYCSPLVDPYQPSEAAHALMPGILRALAGHPPSVFVLQTRGPLVLRDTGWLRSLAGVCTVRISFSVTTDREDVRRRYEPHCAPIAERFETVRRLRSAGLEVYCTVAPILPCNPETLAELALDASGRDLIGDPLHIRATKPGGATTRDAAVQIARRHGEEDWLHPAFQQQVVERIATEAAKRGRRFTCGPKGFSLLAVPAADAAAPARG